jgi:hypothetical protein
MLTHASRFRYLQGVIGSEFIYNPMFRTCSEAFVATQIRPSDSVRWGVPIQFVTASPRLVDMGFHCPVLPSPTMTRRCSMTSASGERRTCGLGVLASYVIESILCFALLSCGTKGHSWRMAGDSRCVAPFLDSGPLMDDATMMLAQPGST